jgi:hypothetical protein
MAAPKVFVSSTCYDLNIVRSELRSFIAGLGYDPQLSEYSDLLYDPRQHTHASCVQEVGSCDLLVLIIGSRYGGRAVPQSLAMIDFTQLSPALLAGDFLKSKENLSITQLEVLKAIIDGIPVFAFVDSGVLHDHHTYEKNKDKAAINEIEFPSIEKQETARYIFEFINFLRLRSEGNAILPFTRLDDIREHLRRQWAFLLQRLLFEQRFKKGEARRIDFLAGQIADLKAAVLTSIGNAELKETARGAIKFRALVEFLFGLGRAGKNVRELLLRDTTWDELLKKMGVKEIITLPESRSMFRGTVIILDDGSHFRATYPSTFIHSLSSKWDEFRQLRHAHKEAVMEALIEYADLRPNFSRMRYHPESYVPEGDLKGSESEEDDEEKGADFKGSY